MADMTGSNSETIRRQQEADLGHPLSRPAQARAPSDRFAVAKGKDHPHRDYVGPEEQAELAEVDADRLALQVSPDADDGSAIGPFRPMDDRDQHE